MNDHRSLRDISIGSQKLRAKILSNSWYKALPAMNSRYNKKKGTDRYLWSGVKTFTPCAARTIIFQRESLNYVIASFTRCTLPFQNVCFLLPICLPCVSCGTYCNAHKCCVVTHRVADIRVAWLVLKQLFTFASIACLSQFLIKNQVETLSEFKIKLKHHFKQ